MSKKLWLLSTVVVAGVLSIVGLRITAAQTGCTAPAQFEVQVLQISPVPGHAPQVVNWSFDYINQRQRFQFLRESGAIASTIVQTSISGTLYQYQFTPSGSCTYKALPQELQQVVVANNFISQTDFTIGGTLLASQYVFPPAHRGSGPLYVVTSDTCLPIFTQEDNGTKKKVYRNATTGIKDPSVFSVPETCTLQ